MIPWTAVGVTSLFVAVLFLIGVGYLASIRRMHDESVHRDMDDPNDRWE